jgi:16S rRNA processing protein RimM
MRRRDSCVRALFRFRTPLFDAPLRDAPNRLNFRRVKSHPSLVLASSASIMLASTMRTTTAGVVGCSNAAARSARKTRVAPAQMRSRGERAQRSAGEDVSSAGAGEEELVQVGAIVGAHSLRGEVRVLPLTDFIQERFMTTGATLRVELEVQPKTKTGYDAPAGDVREVKVRNGRWVTSKGRNDVIVKLAGCDNRNAAEELIGKRLYILPSDRKPLREEDEDSRPDGGDEFYAQELEGLRVIDQTTGNEVGVVEDVVRGAGTQDLLKVGFTELDEDGDEVEYYVYVPFVKDIVPLVDALNGLMEITPPGGLFDIKTPKRTKKQRMRTKARKQPK